MDRRDRKFERPVITSKGRLRVTIEDEEGESSSHELPAKFEVCGTCEGRGRHVNPSIDSEGISAEQFAEDPDFEESYFAGHYDQTCVECDGLRVVPTIDLDHCSAEEKAIAAEHADQESAAYDYETERAAERRMGY